MNRVTRTFHEVFADITPGERTALVWRLAMFRARKTVEVLLIKERLDKAMVSGDRPAPSSGSGPS